MTAEPRDLCFPHQHCPVQFTRVPTNRSLHAMTWDHLLLQSSGCGKISSLPHRQPEF
uniref:UBIQUITIN_CONJUGAT_2 domain-containing protein n=1 Tax=Mesocestoides corti TaxID=53468 RepID=A0A5K3FXW3_MESCO